jgi:hypothetical protein
MGGSLHPLLDDGTDVLERTIEVLQKSGLDSGEFRIPIFAHAIGISVERV